MWHRGIRHWSIEKAVFYVALMLIVATIAIVSILTGA